MAGLALFLLGCLLFINSYIIVQGAQGDVMIHVHNTPGWGQFWVPIEYDLIQVPSYVFTQLIIGVAACTAGIILIYENTGARASLNGV